MDRRSASDFDPGVLALFDRYVHGELDRRGFLERAARYAVGGLTAAMLLDALSPRFAEAAQIPPDDKRVATSTIAIDAAKGNGTIKAYLARPAGKAKARLPAVLVIHENRGLNPHIEDVARRLALEGFAALAPDALTSLGGYPGDEDQARALFAKLDADKAREDFLAAFAALRGRPDVTGKVGVIGFCWGGGMTNQLAVRIPEVAAAVPFYGAQPAVDDVAKIKAPVLAHYADKDDRINGGIAAFEDALKAAKARYEVHRYPGTQHGFHNDTTPRFDAAAAQLAWKRTVAFLHKHVG